MFKLFIFLAVLAVALAAPRPGFLAAPAVAAVPAPLITASSSQYIARHYNTLAAAPIAYAAPLAYSTHAVAPALAAYAAPVLL